MIMVQGFGERLDRFCDLLDEIAELQETLVSVCLAQLQAGIEGDILRLNEKTSAIGFLTSKIAELDKRIRGEVNTIAGMLGMDRFSGRIGDLVGLIPEPWEARIRETLERIKISFLYLKNWSREALPFYRSALKSRRELLRVISPESVEASLGYSVKGMAVETDSHAKFMDNRG